MTSEPSAEEIKGVLTYIDKIQKHDLQNFQRVTSISNIVWGLLFFYSGIIDFMFFLTDHPEFSAIPWFLSSVGGAIATSYISNFKQGEITTKQVKERSQAFSRMHRFILVFIIGGWILTSLFVISGLIHLIIPWVGIMIFFSIISFSRDQEITFKNMFFPSSGILFVATLSLLASLLNIGGLLLFGLSFHAFEGLILGLLVGGGFLQFGLRQRNNWDRSKQ